MDNKANMDKQAAVKQLLYNPLGLAALTAGTVYGLGRLAWNPLASTATSLARLPATKLLGMSGQEWDAMSEELGREEWGRKLPKWLAALGALGVLALNYRPNEEWYGLTKFQGNPRAHVPSPISVTTVDNNVLAPESLDKAGSFDPIDPYMANINFGQVIDARAAKSLFNDGSVAAVDPYAANFGTAVIADAVRNRGNNSITLGNVYDSAVNKFDTKFSLGGLARVSTRTVAANCMSRMFTGAVDTMLGLPDFAKQNLIDAGTWAGAISAIID